MNQWKKATRVVFVVLGFQDDDVKRNVGKVGSTVLQFYGENKQGSIILFSSTDHFPDIAKIYIISFDFGIVCEQTYSYWWLAG